MAELPPEHPRRRSWLVAAAALVVVVGAAGATWASRVDQPDDSTVGTAAAPPTTTTDVFDGHAWAVVIDGPRSADAGVVADAMANAFVAIGGGQAEGFVCSDITFRGVADEQPQFVIEFETEELANQARRAVEAHGFTAEVRPAEDTCQTTSNPGG